MRIEDKNLEVNSKKIKFSFENKEYEAFEGETVASASYPVASVSCFIIFPFRSAIKISKSG